MPRADIYVPTDVFLGIGEGKYMPLQYPVASDFYHKSFANFLSRISHPFQMHRKLWEFAFIEDRLQRAGVLRPGKTGLCFGVGKEQLPALFAIHGCKITATDAPTEIIGESWVENNEFSAKVTDLNFQGIIGEDEFVSLVDYRTCDMNAIDETLRGYDFCWSACCLEHLGNLEKGLQFIINSLDTLKPGGVAVHTTELNLSSNIETVSSGRTVLYRRKDIEEFEKTVIDAGHAIEPLSMIPFATPIDHHVDVPPYENNPHLKLLLEGFVTTSVGICIRKSI